MSTDLELKLTEVFRQFLRNVKDPIAKAKINARLKRLEKNQWGDAPFVGDGLRELRIDTGPGYRVYCKQTGLMVVVVLGGGTKNGQQADIDAAKLRANEL